MLSRWLLVGLFMCAASLVNGGRGGSRRGGGRGGRGGGGGWWGLDHDPSDSCDGCYEYCNITDSDGDVQGGCQCPDEFTCTESHTARVYSGYWWSRTSELITYSKCERDEEEPEHFGPPCLVTKGDDVYNITCPDGFDCDVGPITIVTGYNITYCNYDSEDDVDHDHWWDWYCDAASSVWIHWCSTIDWWGRGPGAWWYHCYRW